MNLKCSNPKKLFYVGFKPNGKKITKFTGVGTDYYIKDGDSYIACRGDPSTVDRSRYRVYTDYDTVPCGTCIACRLKQSMEYAHRGVLESYYHDSAYFLTLTYNDDNLPFVEFVNDDGEYKEFNSLCMNDLQLFNKRLRKNSTNDLTILSCGEYGGRTLRPHYHEIVWDLKLNDLKVYKTFKKNGIVHTYYVSPYLSKLWDKGFVIVANVSFETIAYVCRYNLKKTKNDLSALYESTGCEQEFRNFPKAPALGKRYFDDYWQSIYTNDEIIDKNFRFKTIPPPKYFDRLLEKKDISLYNKIKEERREKYYSDDFDSLDIHELIQLDSHSSSIEKSLSDVVTNLKGGL